MLESFQARVDGEPVGNADGEHSWCCARTGARQAGKVTGLTKGRVWHWQTNQARVYLRYGF